MNMAELIQRTDDLNTGREKLNNAILDAEDAKQKSDHAVNVSEQAKQIAQTAENKADNVQEQFNQVVIEGDSSVEAAQARVDADNNVYATLKERLDTKETQFSTQLAKTKDEVKELRQITATKEELYQESNAKANKSYVDSKFESVNNRIDDIIITPAEGITEQEIIDAREHKNTLGANIREIREKASVGLENKVIDGNFTKGLEEHFVSRPRADFVDGNVILTGESGNITTGIIAQRLANYIPTDENWYFISRIRALDELEWIGVGVRATSGISTSRVYYPTPMKWYTISHYMSGNDYSGLSGNFSAATWGADPEASGKRVEVEYYMAFNLTEAFGRGNEPTKEEIDKLLLDKGYFEGDLGSGRLTNRLIDSQLELEREITKIRHADLENILSYGKGSWRGWTGTFTSYDESNDTVTVKGTGASSIVGALQDIEGRYEKGHKLFVNADITPKTNMRHLGFALATHLTGEENISYLTTDEFVVGKKVNVSGVIEVPTTTEGLRLQLRTRFDTPEETDGAETVFENIFLYDLTSFFGRGNEPTTEGFRLMLESIEVKKGKTELKETQKALTQLTFSEMRKKSEGSTRLERPLAVVSFDDQHLSDYEKAFPFLQMRGIKGTVYVVTSKVGNPGRMDWNHLRELKNAGWDIGFHTHNHINLDQSTDDEIRQDFETGIQTFLDNGFPKPRHFAYPYGRGTDSSRVRNVLSEYVKTARNSRAYFSGVNNTWEGIDFLRMNGLSVDMNEHRQDRLQRIKDMMKHSAENNEIVFLYAHKLVDSPPTNDNIPETIFSMWAELIDYAIDLDFEFVTTEEMYLRVR